MRVFGVVAVLLATSLTVLHPVAASAVPAGPALTFGTLPQGQVGVAYTAPLTATGGTVPYVWSIIAGSLPPGLTLDTGTGLLSGTPTFSDDYTFTVRLVDAAEQDVSKTAALGVTAGLALTFPAPPAGQVGVPYSDLLTVSGGTGPFVWEVSAGALPPGFTLNTATGLLSGTPVAVGSHPFTVRVTDSAALADTKAATLVFSAGPLILVATADMSTVDVGATVTYATSVTNTGQVGFDEVSVRDPLAGVLDDAVYNSDATATAGTVSYAGQILTWTGNLNAGASVTITYTVTVAAPDTGDLILGRAVTSGTLGTNCAPGGTDARCANRVTVSTLDIAKVAGAATALPGETVRYTITVTNNGPAANPAAGFTDDLSAVLDDAAYNSDATATAGIVSAANDVLSWTGRIAAGASVTVSYSVRIRGAETGDGRLTNTTVATGAGSNCSPGSADARCTAVVTVLRPELALTNTASVASTYPGATVDYTVTMTNTGPTAYTAIGVKTSLAGVLDDATYNGDATATTGSISYNAPDLTWTGDLAVGASATMTFSVAVSSPITGDRVLKSVLSSAAVGNSCPTGCLARTTVAIPGLTIVKTVDKPVTTPGSVVRYEIVATNTGQAPYDGASLTDSLTGVLDDATYNADATATSGSVSYGSQVLTWTGNLAVGAAVTITYSVTAADPATGDKNLSGVTASTTPGADCARCTSPVTVLIPGLTITHTADVVTALPGSVITYNTTIANTGQAPYPAATVTGSLAEAIDDATYNADASTDLGTVGVSGSTLTWRGALPVGATATVIFSVTVRDPGPGSKTVSSAVSSAAAGSNCPSDPADPRCSAAVVVLDRGLTISKVADTATARPGATVGYTITATNTGQTPYTGATLAESLARTLHDATYNNDLSATTGAVSYTAPTLSWIGDLAVGASTTITYSVTVLDPDPGSKSLVGTVVSSTPGSNCAATSTDPQCTTSVEVSVPKMTIAMTADPPSAVPGTTVTYTLTVHNAGDTAEPSANVTAGLAGVLDDASYNNDASASAGTAVFQNPNLRWTGSLSAGATVVVTFTGTVHNPVSGDLHLEVQLTSTTPGNTCAGDPPLCTVVVPVARLQIETTSAAGTSPGSVIPITATYTNTGSVDYTGISVTFEATGFIGVATLNRDLSATSGTLTGITNGAVWTGDIPIGSVVVVTGTATVLDPGAGWPISGQSISEAPGNNCPWDSIDPRCVFTVPVQAAELSISVVAGSSGATAYQEVGYTMMVFNGGPEPYQAIAATYDLADVLDDGTYLGDAAATVGVVNLDGTDLVWTGPLAVGALRSSRSPSR